MTTKTFKINPILIIEITSSNQKLIEFFETKFDNLYSDEQKKDELVSISLIEKEHLSIQNAKILREITIPELCIFNDSDFHIVKNQKKIAIPFADIGKSRDITVFFEKGFSIDWIRRLLEDLIDFHMIGFGGTFVHGACVTKEELEIIIPAWRGTGKTNITLHLLQSMNYKYKAEDQFLFFNTGSSYLFTDATHVDYKTISSFASLRKYNSFSFRLRSSVVKLLVPIIPSKGILFDFMRRGLIKALAPKIFLKLSEFIPIALTHEQPQRRAILNLIAQPNLKEPTIEKINPEKCIQRIIHGMLYERLDLLPFYYAWAYATGQKNVVFSNYENYVEDILKNALGPNDTYLEVCVPYGYNWSHNFDRILLPALY